MHLPNHSGYHGPVDFGEIPDPDPKVPFVNERFHADWTPDQSGAGSRTAVVGHNLKIAWNLTRVAHYYRVLADEDVPQ